MLSVGAHGIGKLLQIGVELCQLFIGDDELPSEPDRPPGAAGGLRGPNSTLKHLLDDDLGEWP